jgi:hypothetical protein
MKVRPLCVFGETGIGGALVPATPAASGRWHVVVVSNQADHGVPCHYDITVADGKDKKVANVKCHESYGNDCKSMKGVAPGATASVPATPAAAASSDASTSTGGTPTLTASDGGSGDDPAGTNGNASSGTKESDSKKSADDDSGEDDSSAADADKPDGSSADDLSGSAGDKAGKTEGGTKFAGKQKSDGPKSGLEGADFDK